MYLLYICLHILVRAKFVVMGYLINQLIKFKYFFFQVCDWPFNVECSVNTELTTQGSTERNTDGSTKNTAGISTERSTTPVTITEAPTDNKLEFETLPNGCPSDFHIHHLLPHESDCSKFYNCVHGRKVEENCAPGTLFNYKKQVCNLFNLIS